MLNFKKKVLFGLSVSLVLAMAIGSFAISEAQTPVTPQAAEPSSVTAGAFTITGESVTENTDYTFSGTTESNGVLTIISNKEMTIKNTSTGETNDRIKIDLTSGSEANITLDGVNINTDQGSAFEIKYNATFNVNIALADDSENYLTSANMSCSGLEKVGSSGTGTLTIGVPKGAKGTGQLTAIGGKSGGVGIGAYYDDTSNIHITGGIIKATGGYKSAGIGTGGDSGDVSNIYISGGIITATGCNGGAGIGGTAVANVSNIQISGGSITATGGYLEMGGQKYSGAGIGSGAGGTASGNKLNGNAVVLATSGEDDFSTGGVKPQLDGFADSDRTGGIVFTGVGTYEDDGTGTWVLKNTTWNEGTQYGNVTLTEDTTFPVDFTIESNAALTVGKNSEDKEATLSMAEGKTLKVKGSLINEGVIDIPAENLACDDEGNGEITTLLNYDPQGGEIVTNDDEYITYQDADSVKQYESLPEATKEGYDLEGWYTKEKGQGTKIETTDDVLLNQHILYANWVESEPPTPTPPTPTPPGPEPTPTPPGPEPGPTPEPTPDPSVDPGQDGDGGSSAKTSDPFMGGAALALLGVATTGAVLVRKRK